jgi:hypothetical protein
MRVTFGNLAGGCLISADDLFYRFFAADARNMGEASAYNLGRLPMIWLAVFMAAVAAIGLLWLRVRSGLRWRKMIDNYAEREIAQTRKSFTI